MRLIDADELLFKCNCLNHVAEFAINRAPTVDAQPVVHAKWIRTREDFLNHMCSRCRSDGHILRSRYCPNCGAKMDGDKLKCEDFEEYSYKDAVDGDIYLNPFFGDMWIVDNKRFIKINDGYTVDIDDPKGFVKVGHVDGVINKKIDD